MSSSPMNFLAALCLAFLRFLRACFNKDRNMDLPLPVTSPQPIFHPPPSPLPKISISGLFQPSLSSPSPSPSPSHSHSTATSSQSTPDTPSPSSAVIVHLDRSPSPTTMSDGSLEVISLADRTPLKDPDISRLPSPWSPIGKTALSSVWISADGLLMNASGPVDGDSDKTATPSRLSSVSLYSSRSALDAFGISVLVNLDNETNQLDPTSDKHRATPVIQVKTPPKRRQTLSSIVGSNVTHGSTATKYMSTPLTKLEINHLQSAGSISSMAYELRMGLFADGRSLSAFENIISLLDRTTPESTPPHNDSIPPVEVA